MDPDPDQPTHKSVDAQRMPSIVIDPAGPLLVSDYCDRPEFKSAPKADSRPDSPDAHHHAFLGRDSLHTGTEAVSFASHHGRGISPGHLDEGQVQRQRGDSLTIPKLPSTASFGSSLCSPSSDGGDMATLRSSPSIGTSWRSSRTTLTVHGESDRLLSPESPDCSGRGPYDFAPEDLARMFDPRSIDLFRQAGGLARLAEGLCTSLTTGLSLDESFDQSIGYGSTSVPLPRKRTSPRPFADRIAVFGENRIVERPSKSFFRLLIIALSDRVLLLLSIVSVVSLGLGLYQAICQPHAPGQPRIEWVEGVTIMAAVAIASIVGALNDYQKERQFIKLNRKRQDHSVDVTRSGKSMEISVHDIMVGDLLHLAPGDVAPVDGILITGNNVRCDESSLTGETHLIKKTPGTEVLDRIDAGASSDDLDPFIISGSQVLEGIGTYLATCVGAHSTHGRLLLALHADPEPTALQKKLRNVADQIGKAGVIVSVILFTALFVKLLAKLSMSRASPADIGQKFLHLTITSIAIIVVAVPEGLPLAVTLALAIAVMRMLKDNNLVRILASCETMSNVTTICCDKTGTLTLNEMTVVTGVMGTSLGFGHTREDTASNVPYANGRVAAPRSVSTATFFDVISSEVRDLLIQSIIINSTAFENSSSGKTTFVGSKTESALLALVKERLGVGPIDHERANARVIQAIPFDSTRKSMATVVQLSPNKIRVYIKGAPEILLDKSNRVLRSATESVSTVPMSGHLNQIFSSILEDYASHELRTLAFAFRDLDHWPLSGSARLGDDVGGPNLFDNVFQDLVFIGIIGLQDPLRPGVTEAVSRCHRAGVRVKMVTGDNLCTAKAIATECGILTSEGIALEGIEFRQLSADALDSILPRLQVLARSTPEDKRIFVERLKGHSNREVVAVTGDGTNDGPALRAADVGFSMGISGTEVAKEAASIILMDDNFSSIVRAIEWGRTVNDAIRKFLQFQLTVNITAVILTFVSAIFSSSEESILTPVQLLWVNLIMDTFAALALATDPPNPTVLERKPEPRDAPLVTLDMWKLVIGQSIYQLIIVLGLNFAGNSILGYNTLVGQSRLETVVFNIYVWMQFFNQYNNRRLDRRFNIFEGLHRNWYFLGVNIVTAAGQVLIIQFGGRALSVERLDIIQWAISIALGAMSLVVGVLIRLVPNSLFERERWRRWRWWRSYEPAPSQEEGEAWRDRLISA